MTGAFASLARTFGLDELRAVAEAAGVSATVAVQAAATEEETRDLLAAADEAGGLIAGVVGWVDLTAPDVADRLAALRAAAGGDRLVGIRHQVHDEPDEDWLRRNDVRRGIAGVGDAGLVYDLLVRTRELPAAVDTVRALPDVRFVVDHLAKPPIRAARDDPSTMARWAEAIRPLGALPNAWAKVSGLLAEADWATWTVDDLVGPVRVALEVFGPERLLFGSDWPVSLLAATYPDVLAATDAALAGAGVDVSHRATIFGETAVEVYRLTV